jgi:serine protease Do
MVARVTPAVVRIITMRLASQNSANPAQQAVTTSSGSGFIIDPSGYVGTNKHLVVNAISVFVITADGERHAAKIVGMAAQADIALLRMEDVEKPLPFVSFGDSDKVRVGDRAIAIGSPLGFKNTVTSGIISAINRNINESPFDDYLQTDAAINHGNSGGPLFNAAGEVIGMNSVIFSPDRGSSGLGFAIPSNNLQFAYRRLMKYGKIDAGMLRVHTQPLTWGLKQAFHEPDVQGALVTSVDAGGPVGQIQAGDVIMTLNGQQVTDPRDLARLAARSPIGSDAVLQIHRGDRNETVQVAIAALPEPTPVARKAQPQTLGLKLATEQGAVKVAAVDPAGTAAEAGIKAGDVLVEIQHAQVSQPGQALQALHDVTSREQPYAAILVRRDAQLRWLAVEVPGSPSPRATD